MIELKELRKSYKTGDFEQKALDGVSLTFRDNEFVAVLGPSGSGKTTLLNILGGLDHADSGDIVINGTSTQHYRSADWDTYRNHRIGFIFQSYNLIPHQTIVSNVELALTLAGVGRAERRHRAEAALQRVGLGEHIHKKPSQLSGGQMQRVAIARALVNDPDIVLADEPTGALDTETGLAVMNLLQEIANDRLVIMVTHNPELAEQYATRIVRLADGQITDDTDPVAAPLIATPIAPQVEPSTPQTPARRRRARMSFLTALGLSFNNLMTKKGRTFMTAFAGSIGIIGIAAILALSNGVNNYIADTEEEALTSYPLTITKSSFDISNLLTVGMGYGASDDEDEQAALDTSAPIPENDIMTDMFAEVTNNDLAAFKTYLESGTSGIEPYVNTIRYRYGIVPQVYQADTRDVVQLNPSSMSSTFGNSMMGSAFSLGSSSSMNAFTEMMENTALYQNQMDVVVGRWPTEYDECALVLNGAGEVSDYTLYSLGVYDTSIMDQMVQDALNGEEVVAPETSRDFTYDQAMQLHFTVVPSFQLYQYNAEQRIWTDISGDDEVMRARLAEGIDLHVVGILQPKDAMSASLSEGIVYPFALTRHLMELAAESDIVRQQLADPDVDVFTGKTFEELQDDQANEFDLQSMFDVDEDAMADAFSMDADALDFGDMSLDLSGVDFDLGGLDMSGFDLSGLDLSSLDLGSMDVDPGSFADAFDAASMVSVMQNAPQFQADSLDFANAIADLPPEQQEAASQAANQLATGFFAWLLASGHLLEPNPDFAALFLEYLTADEGAQAILAQTSSLAGEALAQTINDAMTSYMTEQFAPYMQQAMTALMAQAAQTMMTQMATQMAQNMATAMGTQLSSMVAGQMAGAMEGMSSQLASAISSQLEDQLGGLADKLQDGFSFDADAFTGAINFNMDQDDLTSLFYNLMNADELTYDGNMGKLGYATLENPESISIYPIDFPAKEQVIAIIDAYNERLEAAGDDAGTIQYSDIAGTLMSSVTDIVDTISLVLIAFVSISLVVSSIMIGIITYISVLERKKEIGILRAMGASKGNIANVFNAETVIEGLIAGVLAIAVVLAASVPVNVLVEAGFDVPNVMSLPWDAAVLLVGLSVLLTFVAGLLPSQAAARRDPVEALRSE